MVKFNECFKELDTSYDPDSSSFDIQVEDARLIVNFNEKTGQVSNVELSNVSSNRGYKEYIITKTKSLEYDGWDIQQHYNEEYGLRYDKIGHVINLENENIDESKDAFIKFMSECK